MFARIQQEHGGLDFLVHGVAFANRDDITNPFVQTSRDGFRMALDISAYSLIALARGAKPLMEARGGGSILTLTYLGSTRVFPNYNVMGVAKAALESSVRYLAADLGPQNIRVNAISAGPGQDARRRRHRRVLDDPRRRPRTAPLRRTIETRRSGRRRGVPARLWRPRRHWRESLMVDVRDITSIAACKSQVRVRSAKRDVRVRSLCGVRRRATRPPTGSVVGHARGAQPAHRVADHAGGPHTRQRVSGVVTADAMHLAVDPAARAAPRAIALSA